MKAVFVTLVILLALSWQDSNNNNNNNIRILVGAQETVSTTTTTCSSSGISSCASSNQLCTIDTSSGTATETCGPCVDGYVEFMNSCIHVGDLNVQDFWNVFKPLFRHQGDDNNSSAHQNALQQMGSYISSHNSQQPAPQFWLSLNKFASDTADEVKQRLGFTPASNDTSQRIPPVNTSGAVTSTHVDWVQAGAVTAVKDQGRCGCCWAVAAAEVLEGKAAIDSNYTYVQSLSFQQFISCDDTDMGCNGGDPVNALLYAEQNSFGGVVRLNDYEFSDAAGTTTQMCQLGSQQLAVATSGVGYVVTTDKYDAFSSRVSKMKAVLSQQPIAVLMSAYCDTMTAYSAGIITDDGLCACADPSCLDHAVLLVGFDDDDSTPYWKVKNSWGTDWGEQGYFRVAQSNPTGSASSWGLFGLMAEGVVPEQAYNVTSQVTDKSQNGTGSLDVWMIATIAAACLAALLVAHWFCTCICRMCCGGNNRKEPQHDY